MATYFTDTTRGYVVGWSGSILGTTNGGGFPVSVEEHISNGKTLTIYPNPASTFITVETNAAKAISQLSITNLNGQQLISRQITDPKTQIDISNLPNGVYFVRLTNDKSVEVGKFVKQ